LRDKDPFLRYGHIYIYIYIYISDSHSLHPVVSRSLRSLANYILYITNFVLFVVVFNRCARQELL